MHKITNGLTGVTEYLVTFGAFGLFAIALLDSALIPLPGGADAVMMLLSAARPSWIIFYALAATLGSTVGSVVLYYISQRAGSRALNRFSAEKQARVKGWIDKYDVWSVLVASLLPPPFPFKLFVISAGVFRLNVVRFAIAVAVGRMFRFLLEGYLAMRYGDHAKELLSAYYPYIGLGLAVVIVAFFIVKLLFNRGDKPTLEDTIKPEEV